jgi:methionyl-tRNA synthetase
MLGDGKMSKSKGNVIYAEDLVEYFGVEPVRYFLLSEMPFDNDGVITYELMINKINSDLSNILGNLVNRTLTMVNKYFDGIIPEIGIKEDVDNELIELALETKNIVQKEMDGLRTGKALNAIFTLLRRSNKYIDETKPWILGKDDTQQDRLGTVLYNLLECIRISSVLLIPFIPKTAKEIQRQINTKNISLESLNKFDGTISLEKINDPSPIFNRMDFNEKLKEIEKSISSKIKKEKKKETKQKDTNKKIEDNVGLIGFDEFLKVKMVVGEIIEVKDHPNADKLYLLKIDLKTEIRQVVAGLKKFYTKEELLNKKIVMVANLKPAKLRGEISQGMLLAAESDKDTVKLLTVDIENGATIR